MGITFTAGPGNSFHIYLISAEGGSPDQLTNGEHDEGDVGWSADGRRLVFGCMNATEDYEVVIHVFDLRTHQTSVLPNSIGLFAPLVAPLPVDWPRT